MDIRQSREYCSFQESCGWKIEQVKRKGGGKVVVLIKQLSIFTLSIGVMKCQRFEGYLDRDGVRRIKRKWRVVYSIWEPGDRAGAEYCRKQGMKQVKVGYLPSATQVIRIDMDRENIWKEISKDARRLIKMADQADVLVKCVGEEEEKRGRFWNEWRKWGKGYIQSRDKFGRLLDSFGEKALVMVAEKETEWLAGMVVLICNNKAYYYFAWTSKQGRLVGAQYKLVWEGILTAKERGVKEWDFEGVEDSRSAHKSWRGFSVFKKKFGGKEVKFPMSFREWF